MTSQKINPRVKQILLELCCADDYITLAAIAEKVQVSAKTIMRDLPLAERILQDAGLTLAKKTGSGLKIPASNKDRATLARQLGEQATETVYTPSERRRIITEKLLDNQTPVKLYEFTQKLKVAESTVSNDLDKLECWFKERRLNLIRKPGLGVFLQGSEQDLRKAVLQFIYENNDENLFFRILRGKSSNSISCDRNNTAKIGKLLLNLIDADTIVKLQLILQENERINEKQLSDNAYIGLILHLALSVKRIKRKDYIEIEETFLHELRLNEEYGIARQLSEKIGESFSIETPEAETAYIAMHLLGAKSQYTALRAAKSAVGNFQLVQLARDMIKIVQRETGVNLASDHKLLAGLVNHLGPSISRLKMNLEIRNPLLNDMKSYYPDLMRVSEKCAKLLKEKMNLALPEAEIAFIAMHIGAAIESRHTLFKPIHRIAVACPAGIGSSQLLATKIQAEYPNLKVTEIVSALHIDEAKLQEKGVRFIISTIAIPHCGLPVVTVNSLFSDIDKLTIDNQINLLNKAATACPADTKSSRALTERLTVLTDYSQAVLELLRHFFLIQDSAAACMEELIAESAACVKPSGGAAGALSEALWRRHRQGAAVIGGQRLLLLHCRADQIAHLQFGVIQLKTAFMLEEETADGQPVQVQTAVLMLAPQKVSPYKLETISYLAKMLVERWGFAELLRDGSRDLIYFELNNLLEEFFKAKNTTLMEG